MVLSFILPQPFLFQAEYLSVQSFLIKSHSIPFKLFVAYLWTFLVCLYLFYEENIQIVNILAICNSIFCIISTIFLILSVMLLACLVLLIAGLIFSRL